MRAEALTSGEQSERDEDTIRYSTKVKVLVDGQQFVLLDLNRQFPLHLISICLRGSYKKKLPYPLPASVGIGFEFAFPYNKARYPDVGEGVYQLLFVIEVRGPREHPTVPVVAEQLDHLGDALLWLLRVGARDDEIRVLVVPELGEPSPESAIA